MKALKVVVCTAFLAATVGCGEGATKTGTGGNGSSGNAAGGANAAQGAGGTAGGSGSK